MVCVHVRVRVRVCAHVRVYMSMRMDIKNAYKYTIMMHTYLCARMHQYIHPYTLYICVLKC